MDQHLVLLDNLPFPIFNYKRHPNCAITPANIFAMAFGLYMIAAPMMGWIDYNSPSLASCLCFGGICEYLIGFYNWYEGRGLQSFIDFIFGLLHLTIYFTSELGKYSIPVPYEYHTYMQGVFYCLWFAILLFVILSARTRGCIHVVYLFLIALATVFIIIWEFSKRTWCRKTAGYMLFIASIFIWYTGLARLFGNIYSNDCFPFVTPFW